MSQNQLFLASQSPRRKSLLTQLGYTFNVQASDIDETLLAQENPADYVLRLAIDKAQRVFQTLSSSTKKTAVVIGSDTSVVINNVILGKPEDLNDCIETLSLLSNHQHQVLTAIAVVSNNKVKTQLVTTKVSFKALTLAEIKAYWNTGEPQDKAGSYAIQGIAGQFVKSINGSYSAVVGLPLYETAELLSQFDLPKILPKIEPKT
jgi:septum formation protein